jgi:hypothetical protein
MKLAALLCAVSFAIAADRGLPVRGNVADYPAHAEDKGVVVAAEVMDPEVVRGSFSTELKDYVVVEVAIYPKKDGKPLEVSTIDFGLRADGRMVRPAQARSIARINQKKGRDDGRDITLYPSVGVQTGTWGTGTMVGVGVGVGPRGQRGPASSDRDREVMEQELDDKGLQEALVSKPVAGYLYFPVGSKRKPASYRLEYQLDGVDIKLELPAPKTK